MIIGESHGYIHHRKSRSKALQDDSLSDCKNQMEDERQAKSFHILLYYPFRGCILTHILFGWHHFFKKIPFICEIAKKYVL